MSKPIHPLRKVMGFEPHPTCKGRLVEVLECGHRANIKTDIFGETNAIRRRCRKCKPTPPEKEEK